MGKRILGLDLGTNSIGWGVVDDLGSGQFEVIKRGVHIFQEGVKIEKGNESSKASERTGYRSARRLKFRRKLRKVRTLKVLSEAGYCPLLSDGELKAWQSKKVYPSNPAFREWCMTSDPKDKDAGVYENPYYYRWLAATTELNLNDEADRLKLGRAFYHMAQRRGFKSNRLDTTQESDGVVKKDIDELSKKIGDRTLGEYFWEECYQKGEKIRNVHTSRDDHYLAEFESVCEKQGIPAELKDKLQRSIFFQRPIKSQKGLVASCPFEPKKKRAPISHPLFEEFRMVQTLNNIKIQMGTNDPFRPLTEEEKKVATVKFFRVSKSQFDFKDIAKELSKARNVGAKFNYRDNQSLSGCPFSSQLSNLFGEDYRQVIFDSYEGNKVTKSGDKRSPDDILHEVWHVLFSFDDMAKVKEYATNKLGMDNGDSEKFAKIKVRQGYGALSLKAIRMILPFLRQGLIYSHAVFFANLDEVIGRSVEDNEQLKLDIENLVDSHRQYIAEAQCVNSFVREYKDNPRAFEEKYDLRNAQVLEQHLPTDLRDNPAMLAETLREQIAQNNGNGEYLTVLRLEGRVGKYLEKEFDVSPAQVKKLYHPSKEETYKPAPRHSDGKYYLGDPRISSIKNPVFMRAMHRLKAVVNELLKQGVINDQTLVHLEMARELNDANKRAAIRTWQRQNETKRKQYKETIEEHLKAQGHEREADAGEILKYQLWLEQNENCVYCGDKIGLAELLSSDCEIEHTIPRSLCCDDSQENKTLAHRTCNRDKHKRIPFECANHDEILQHIAHWQERVDDLNKLIERKRKASRSATTKELKDRAIQARVVLEMDRNYLREKHRRFTMEDVPGGFKNSQLVDTRIITKYARAYLKTVFNTVHTVNGKTTDSFRRCWGIEKTRDNHAHHTVDAIVAACVTRDQYDRLARYYHDYESYELGDRPAEPHFLKPWETFTEDMKALKNEILVSNYSPNNLLKQARKKLRSNGTIQRTNAGAIKYQQGKTARGSLHKDTFYGRIKANGEERTVARVPLAYSSSGGLFGFKNVDDFERIVDRTVREKVKDVFKHRCSQRTKFVDAFKEPVWMNEGKKIPVKKVRCFVGAVKNPLPLKIHSTLSKQKHKQHFYVQNDSVHMVAVYASEADVHHVGFSALDAVVHGVDVAESLTHKRNDYGLKHVLHADQLVIFCKEGANELQTLPIEDICRRLYKINDLSMAESRMVFRHHMEAREKGKVVEENQVLRGTNYPSSMDFDSPNPLQRISYRNMNAAVEGVDFQLNVLGEIEFKEGRAC